MVTWKVPANVGITVVSDGRSQISSTTTNFVKVVHVDAYSTMLIIDRVTVDFQGDYTCNIANAVDQVSKTVPLIVHGTEKIIINYFFFELSL